MRMFRKPSIWGMVAVCFFQATMPMIALDLDGTLEKHDPAQASDGAPKGVCRPAGTDSSSTSQTGTVKVNTSLNIRVGPWGKIIGKFHNGDQVQITGRQGDWLKISWNGQTAFVHSKYVTINGADSNSTVAGGNSGSTDNSGTSGSTSSTGTTTPVGGAPNGRSGIERMFGQRGTNQVTVTMPAGPGGRNVSVTCHRLIADKLKAVFEEIKSLGLSGDIHTFDGCYNNRNKRGGSTPSVHSWGIAVDINASENPMGRNNPTAGQQRLAAVFARHGFHQLSTDRMHFQYCTGY